MQGDLPSWPPSEWYSDCAERCSTYLRNELPLSLPDGSGPIQQLEQEYSKQARQPFALACNSGTSALHSAYFALDLGPGDEVIGSAYSFHSSLTPLLHTPARPVLADIDPTTGGLSAESVLACLTGRTRAITVTHMYGYPVELDEIRIIATENNLYIIEDCSHAHGAQFLNGMPVGSIGDAAVFSLQESKLAPAGEGGLLLMRDEEMFDRAVALGHFGHRARHVSTGALSQLGDTGFGLKYRMHPLAALCGLAGVELAKKYLPERRILAEIISRSLSESRLFRFRWHPTASYYLFRLSVNARSSQELSQLYATADDRGIPLRKASMSPLTSLPAFSGQVELGRLEAGWMTTPAVVPMTLEYANQLASMPRLWALDHSDLLRELLESLLQLERDIT